MVGSFWSELTEPMYQIRHTLQLLGHGVWQAIVQGGDVLAGFRLSCWLRITGVHPCTCGAGALEMDDVPHRKNMYRNFLSCRASEVWLPDLAWAAGVKGMAAATPPAAAAAAVAVAAATDGNSAAAAAVGTSGPDCKRLSQETQSSAAAAAAAAAEEAVAGVDSSAGVAAGGKTASTGSATAAAADGAVVEGVADLGSSAGVAVGEVTWRRLHAMGPTALLQQQMELGLLASLSTTQ
jgi:hypothetical protein